MFVCAAEEVVEGLSDFELEFEFELELELEFVFELELELELEFEFEFDFAGGVAFEESFAVAGRATRARARETALKVATPLNFMRLTSLVGGS